MKKRKLHPLLAKGVRLLAILIILVAGVICVQVGSYLLYPPIAPLAQSAPGKTAFMEYREEEWKRQGLKKTVQYRWVPLARISPLLVKAVIIAEDDKFWVHDGFDFAAMQKALEKDLKKMALRAGGSTISQQLAKNLFLSPRRTVMRKLKEAVLTWRLERRLSKRRIIELYLNVAEWGDGVFGAEAAAQVHFGKSAASLSAMEAAKLAAALPNPRRFNPLGTSRYAAQRAETIHLIMVRRGIVIPEFEEILPSAAATDRRDPGRDAVAEPAPDFGERDAAP